MQHERTLILIKPDAVSRGLVGEIITRFEKVGLKIVGMKMIRPSEQEFHHHYETIGQVISRRGQKVFDAVLQFMTGGPVVAIVAEGIEAVSLVRKIVGGTEPKTAAPGTIRGDYSHVSYAHADAHNISTPNIIHASGDPAEAKLEVEHWFTDKELFDYHNVHEKYTLAKSF